VHLNCVFGRYLFEELKINQMKILIVFLLPILLSNISIAQKKAIDYSIDENWPNLQSEMISNNGQYVVYSIGSKSKGPIWTVQATDGSWKKDFNGIKNIAFTPDSRRLILINNNDSLCISDLTKNTMSYFAQVSSFQQAIDGDGRWLAFIRKMPVGELILLDLFTGVQKEYINVNEFLFDDSARTLILQIGGQSDSIRLQSTAIVNLLDGAASVIDHNLGTNNFAFYGRGHQLAFIAEESSGGQSYRVLKYYQSGMDSATVVAGPGTYGKDGLRIVGNVFFSKRGNKMFFKTMKSKVITSLRSFSDVARVDVRNYKSENGAKTEAGVGIYWACAVVGDRRKVTILEQEKDFPSFSRLWVDQDGDNAIVEGLPSRKADPNKANDQLRRNLYLLCIKNGTRNIIKSNAIIRSFLSPTGKYVIFYDREKGQWFTYRTLDGLIRNVTNSIPTPLFNKYDNVGGISRDEGIAGWLENDKMVFIYDCYDIWGVDPDGIKLALNITSGIGRKENIRFRYMDFAQRPDGDFNSQQSKWLRLGDTLLLSAFNTLTKDNGFFSLVLGKDSKPHKLSTGHYCYYFPFTSDEPDLQGICNPVFPIKARSANAYIMRRMDASEYPNICFTKNFKEFKLLTNLEPQKEYNWYSTELIQFILPNGGRSEAILYKPEDFDPNKKYPVIFYYYEGNTAALHLFINPVLSNGAMSIPRFVSSGYLVCVPDIVFYKPGYPGECIYRAVNAVANVLSQKPWVNTKAMGLQGISFGGYGTDYIVTRTHRFAAAAPSSAFCDAISFNYQIHTSGVYFEISQGRLGASLWANPKVYIQNSPIYYADKVTTPLLIMHNMNDSNSPFMQEKEWYNALTHLHKKVWLLSYDDEHVLYDTNNQLDYSIRLQQFFDYYLKGALPPKWMTSDLNNERGQDNSPFDLDTTRKRP